MSRSALLILIVAAVSSRSSRYTVARLGHDAVACGLMERPRTYRKRRDVHDEPVETVTRQCLRCRRPFQSEGAHHRLCYPCASESVSPYSL